MRFKIQIFLVLVVFFTLSYVNWDQSIKIPKLEKALKQKRLELENIKIKISGKEIEYNSMLATNKIKEEMTSKGMKPCEKINLFDIND